MLNKMVTLSENFYKSLNLSHRTVSIASAECNLSTSIKYDIEVLFPFENKYRELVSCSNCTDYQSRSLNIKI